MTSGVRSILLVLCGVLGATSCKDGATQPQGPAAVMSLTISGPTAVTAGQSITLSAVAKDAGGNALTGRTITWSSSAPNLATVENDGTVHALRRGEVTISASSEGRSATHTVQIATNVAAVVVSAPPPSLEVGDTVQLTATVKDAGGATLTDYTVTWSSSDPARAKVLNDGRVIGSASGIATITASAEGKSADVSMSVVFFWSEIQMGYDHACGLGSGARLYCWGGNAEGQVGDGSKSDRDRPVAIVADRRWTSVAARGYHSCAVSAGVGYCWGKNTRGQLGSGGTLASTTPSPLSGTVPQFATIVGGAEHSCALTANGAAYCWGRNDPGPLGDGTNVDRPTPTPVLGGIAFATLIPGGYHTCGLTDDGTAYCWGSNTQGAVGCGTTDAECGNESFWRFNPKAPQPVRGELKFRMLAAGNAHTCGITLEGSLYCWGRDGEGQLGATTNENCTPGSGATPCSHLPLLVSPGTQFTFVAAAFQHTCAITTTGVTECWGDNNSGQIGDGSTTNRSTPTPVSTNVTLVSLAAGQGTSCGLTASNDLYCWGRNHLGQIGDGTRTLRQTPTLVPKP